MPAARRVRRRRPRRRVVTHREDQPHPQRRRDRQLTVRADSAFYSKTMLVTAAKFDVRFSITARA